VKIAIITSYSTESTPFLLRCHRSVVEQTHKDVRHFIVTGSTPNSVIDTWNCQHIKLSANEDVTDAAKCAAASIAAAQEYDAICFLNPESWYEKDHIEEMIEAANRTQATIITCPRNIYRLDNTFMFVDQESDGIMFNDINTYMFLKPAFSYIRALGFKDKKISLISDRFLWKEIISSNVSVGRSFKATVNTTTVFAHHFNKIDEKVPEKSRILVQVGDEYKIIFYEDYLKIMEAQKIKEQNEKRETA